MRVKLLTTFEHLDAMEYNAAYAMLTCHSNVERLEHYPARDFIERAIKAEHETILEHITLTYEVNDLSRACLQELSRHRHISLSVESTRHTLRKQCNKNFVDKHFPYGNNDFGMTYLKYVEAMHFIMFAQGHDTAKNDELKYFLPEFWPTNLVLTANVRELRHIIELRTAPAALKEFQQLAHEFVNVLPSSFKYLLKDCEYVDKK